MPITYTLSEKEFKDLHNGLCAIRNVFRQLEGVLLSEKTQAIKNGFKSIDQGLAPLYKKEQDHFRGRMKYFDAVANHRNLKTVWSLFSVENIYAQHDWQGSEYLIYNTSMGHGMSPKMIPIKGKTWVDLWEAAEAAINDSGDMHHIFIEDFRPSKEFPNTLCLHTGS